jgi:DNA-binding MarR family transcriptional regulator
MPDDEITVSREMLKAIGAESRIGILKALRERQKTQSELATELKLSAPTVLEHATQLEKAGLIERIPEEVERKWKYYRLTKTGRNLVERKRMNMVLLLSGSLFAALASIYLVLSPLAGQPQPVPVMAVAEAKTLATAAAVPQSAYQLGSIELVALGVSIFVAAACVWYLIKKKY